MASDDVEMSYISFGNFCVQEMLKEFALFFGWFGIFLYIVKTPVYSCTRTNINYCKCKTCYKNLIWT